MSMESDLTTLLKALCPRVSPDVAPVGTATPYITYQGIGGQPLRYLDNSAADRRHTSVQVNVWHATRAGALQLIRQVEEAMCATSAPFTARPEGEPLWDAETGLDPKLFGCLQDFSVWSLR